MIGHMVTDQIILNWLPFLGLDFGIEILISLPSKSRIIESAVPRLSFLVISAD